MRVTVQRVPRRGEAEVLELHEDATAESVVRRLGAHPDAVLVVRAGSAIPLDAPVEDGDDLKVVSVVSGG